VSQQSTLSNAGSLDTDGKLKTTEKTFSIINAAKMISAP
jgi:hypothetical protein